MSIERGAPRNFEEYSSSFPQDVQEILGKIRLTIRKAAPDAEETIKYQMPTFMLDGNLVYFAAFRKHIGFYPGSKAVRDRFQELTKYDGKAGSIRFPLDQPVPYDLIGRMVKFRVNENKKRAAAKRKK